MSENRPNMESEGFNVAQFEELVMLMVWRQRRRFGQSLSTLGLTMPQFLALMFVKAHGSGCAMGDLAESTEQCSATMTGIVDRLANMGLVKRERDASDRRSVIVVLTGAGDALLEKAKAERVERTRHLLSHFTPEELQTNLDLLVRYLDVLSSDAG